MEPKKPTAVFDSGYSALSTLGDPKDGKVITDVSRDGCTVAVWGKDRRPP